MLLFPCNEHHAEPCFALHHASVSISSLFERNCLDHRADILQDAEGNGVLGIISKVTHFVVPFPSQDCNIMQSIFRPPSRRPPSDSSPSVSRRDAGLKML